MRLYFDTASHLLLGAPGSRKPLEKLTLTASDLANVEIHFYRGFAPEELITPTIIIGVKASFDAEEYVGAGDNYEEGEVANCYKCTLVVSKAAVSELLDDNDEIELILGMRVDCTGYGPWISQPVTIVLSNTVIGDLPDIPAPPSLQALLNEKVDRSGDTMTGDLYWGNPGSGNGALINTDGLLVSSYDEESEVFLDGTSCRADGIRHFDTTGSIRVTRQEAPIGGNYTQRHQAADGTLALLGDAVPYAASAYVIPAVTTNNATNGANFRAAYAAAAALTPGGNALSSTNRACVLLLPGTYDWTVFGSFTALAFVDIAGISGNRSDVQLVGGWATTSVNYNVSNLTAGANAFTGGGGDFSGIATNCTGGTNSFAGGGVFSGTAINCAGGEGAFGGVAVFSGTATNCVGGDYAFGGLFGTFSGTATGCKAGEYSYGGGGTFSGIATNCTAGDSSFAGSGGIFSGTATGCTGGGASFGGYGTFSGTATGCTGGEGCFTGEGGVFTGTPRITDCVADASSFGASFGTPVDFSGATSVLVKDCRLITGLFTNLDAKYKVRSCLNDDLTEANFN